ncbi:MAG: RNA polymerase sigma-70 factor [Bacteroidota bacterium]
MQALTVQEEPLSPLSVASLFNTEREPLSDEALLEAMRESNYRAFEQLFHRYYQLLCKRAFGLTHCTFKSEEIVSDVFIKIWKNRSTIKLDSKVKYYLYRAIRNQAVDYLRKQIKERNYKGEINQEFESGYSQPDELMIGKELHVKMEAAIESLPRQGRHIFRLSRDEGMKYREIADLLDISIRTVETHMRRSLIYLRARLARD